MFLFVNYIFTKLDIYVFYHVFRPLLSFSTMYLDLFFRFSSFNSVEYCFYSNYLSDHVVLVQVLKGHITL